VHATGVTLAAGPAPAFSLILSTTVAMLLHEVPASWLLLATSLWDSGIVFSKLILISLINEVRTSLSRRIGGRGSSGEEGREQEHESGVGRSQQPCIGLRGWSYAFGSGGRETLQRPPLQSRGPGPMSPPEVCVFGNGASVPLTPQARLDVARRPLPAGRRR